MGIRFLSVIFLILSFLQCEAQDSVPCPPPENKKAQKLIKEADGNIKTKHFPDAIMLLKEAIEMEPDYVDAHFKMGVIYITRSDNNLKMAQKYFDKVLELCPDYDPYLYFYLGDIAYSNGDNATAAKDMKRFLKDVDKIKNDKDYDRAEAILKYAGFDAEITAKPVPFNPMPLQGIDSPRDEYLAIISPDNEMALFTRVVKLPPDRNRPFAQGESMKERFMFSFRKNGVFEEAAEMPYPFNQNDNEGGATLTIDNKKLFYSVTKNSKSGDYRNTDIYYSEYKYGTWDDIQKLDSTINRPDSWDTQPSISSDGKTLYFVSDRKGYGGYDIYKSTQDAKGKWTTAVNLGPAINTAGNEKTPFIHPDNHTLYFASDGQMGLGGYDIFYSKLKEDGSWGKARNIGYPINTPENESGFFVSTDGHYGYFASDKYQGPGGWDIFSFDLYPEARPEKVLFVKGELKDEENKEPVKAKIELKNAVTKKVTEIPVDSVTGEYAAVVLFRNDYIMTVKKEGYGYESKYIADVDSVYSEPKRIDMEIKPIKVGESYKLNDIYFETDMFELKPEAKSIIDGFKEFLDENPNIKISIQGFTDDVGNDEYNLKLSENRAKAVYEYLLQLGTNVGRMTFKGFGETMPVAPNTTNEGRAKNRRTVFVITEK